VDTSITIPALTLSQGAVAETANALRARGNKRG
jgi:hypothetical protein